MSEQASTLPLSDATGVDNHRVGTLVKKHYLHDLSVENPIGRVSDEDLGALGYGMEGDVNEVKMDAPNHHLVSIHLQVTAKLHERVVFLLELTYRVEVELHNVEAKVAAFALAVTVPEAVFPVVQQLINTNAAYSGYPEMQVSAPNFHAIFWAKQQAPSVTASIH
jgi:protein-export chaperone SecB